MSADLAVHLEAVGLVGPGLPSFEAGRAVLRGEAEYRPEVLAKPVADSLPPRDRRRHTFTIALAVTTALQAVPLDRAGELPAVFACSGGDTDVIDRICAALLQPCRPVSPQQFMNSVHNAAAGYWSIAGGNRAAITSLSAYDASFAAGLLEAAVQIEAGRERVLLVAYDTPAPMPIWPFRPLTAPFATALLLSGAAEEGRAMARFGLALARDDEETPIAMPALEKLRLGNPAARALPLLDAFANHRRSRVALPYLAPKTLMVEVEPC